MTQAMNALYYGDNLHVLRESLRDESVDLIYLDPPFNSQANYNVLFRGPSGEQSKAQIEAFEDTWHWTDEAERAFDEVMRCGNTNIAEMLRAMRSFLKENDMMAYLTMMAVRLFVLRGVLKPTGSLYLHCDPTASHYLKILLDAVFGANRFLSEVIWKRTSSHNSARRWGPIHDVVLQYRKGDAYTWNRVFTEYDDGYVSRYYRFTDGIGRKYRLSDLTGSGTRNGESGQPWNNFDPTKHGRHWAVPSVVKEEFPGISALTPHQWLDLFQSEGMIEMTGEGVGWPHVRRYLDRMPGQSLQDVVTDIPPLTQRHAERLGYPTQKPTALLERIIQASSNPGDTVLDPFCGCGTTIHAAQKLDRSWIGIDITHLAISLIEKRLNDAFPGIKYEVHGTPKDVDGARALAKQDKYQFQWWAVSLVDAVPYGGKKKGADSGIDGYIYFKPDGKTTEKAVVSVKGGDNVNVAMIRDLAHVVDREKAKIGVFITLAEPTAPMRTEAIKAGFFKPPYGQECAKIQILTIRELFEGRQPKIPLIDTSAFRTAKLEAQAIQPKLFGPTQHD